MRKHIFFPVAIRIPLEPIKTQFVFCQGLNSPVRSLSSNENMLEDEEIYLNNFLVLILQINLTSSLNPKHWSNLRINLPACSAGLFGSAPRKMQFKNGLGQNLEWMTKSSVLSWCNLHWKSFSSFSDDCFAHKNLSQTFIVSGRLLNIIL